MLINFIVNPGKAIYSMDELGKYPKKPDSTNLYSRDDFQITVKRNGVDIKLECSLYLLNKPAPCIIYMHGNASCRVEGYNNIDIAAATNCHLFVFDFAGTGKSEGTYISLGYFEKDDLKTICEQLSANKLIKYFFLWGRSMGAATLLMHMVKYHPANVKGLICDSSFTDLKTQMNEMAQQFIPMQSGSVFDTMKKYLIEGLCMRLMKEFSIDVQNLSPITGVSDLYTPILFLHASNDQLIQPHHGKEIYTKYGTSHPMVGKQLLNFGGDHNDPRPKKVRTAIADFFRTIQANYQQ
jgi:predicted alpha/beta-fold hydrolase